VEEEWISGGVLTRLRLRPTSCISVLARHCG
jgi:hypothetical protein